MYEFRPFQNSDPPRLASIWRQQAPLRGLMQPMTAEVLEETVLAKPYFDRRGMIVATRGGEPVGFVHAGFGPEDCGFDLDSALGVTCMLMVAPDEAQTDLAGELVQHSETYLREQGAKVLYAGGISPLNPFYLGLYGGSELPGILASDAARQALFAGKGYREIDRVIVLHLDLAGFRPLMDRQQLQHRRKMSVDQADDPRSGSWWEACTQGGLERAKFRVGHPEIEAHAMLWNMEPLASSWGVRAAGLLHLEVDSAHRRQGIATFLLGETFKQIQAQGLTTVEAQAMQHNTPALALYKKLGFREIDQGVVMRKETG